MMKLVDKSLVSIYKAQVRTALLALIAELPNLILSVIIAFSANSILCWIDSVVSFSTCLHLSLVMFVSIKMVKETGDKYNYGLERLEVFTSFICDLLISLVMLILLGTSIYGFFVLQYPTDNLLYFVIVKSVNIAFDVVFCISGFRIAKKRKSRLNETEFNVYLNNLIHDTLIGITVVICYFIRGNKIAALLSPIVGIISILYFVYTYIKHIRKLVKELADVSIPIQDQDVIFDIVLNNKEGIKRISSVNCHTLNGKLYVDIILSFHDQITYEQQSLFLKDIKSQIQEKYKNATVRLVFEDNENLAT